MAFSLMTSAECMTNKCAQLSAFMNSVVLGKEFIKKGMCLVHDYIVTLEYLLNSNEMDIPGAAMLDNLLSCAISAPHRMMHTS